MALVIAKSYTDRHDRGGGASASDWNENNKANPGYIKNRTHYDSRTEGLLLSSSGENVTFGDME